MADRGLSRAFLDDLKVGSLAPLLERVQRDGTLHLAIRNEYVNIYYRGGNLLRVARNPNGAGATRTYTATFDVNYFTGSPPRPFGECPRWIAGKSDCARWIDVFPILKQGMDLWFAGHSKLEREYQQLVARANNRERAATATDYFIIDIEYAEGQDRFDMIAAFWESSGPARKAACARLALIEMKYGDGALIGAAGTDKRIRGMNKFAGTPGSIDRIKAEAITMFEQQLEIRTIHAPKTIDQFTAEEPAYTKGADAMQRSRSAYRRKSISFEIEAFDRTVRQIAALAKAGAPIHPEYFYPPLKQHRGKSRDLPIVSPELREALTEYLRVRMDKAGRLRPTDPLFLTQKGGPYSPNTLQEHTALMLRGWASIEKVSSHCGHRSVITNVIHKRADPVH